MFVAALLVGLVSGMLSPVAPIATAQEDPRYFAETGFRVGNDRFWDYFQRRGGVRTFGYPTSREFQLQGFRVQFFQRGVLQLWPDGSVKTLNLLDRCVVRCSTPAVCTAAWTCGARFHTSNAAGRRRAAAV